MADKEKKSEKTGFNPEMKLPPVTFQNFVGIRTSENEEKYCKNATYEPLKK